MSGFENECMQVGSAPLSMESFEWLHADITKATGKNATSITIEDFSGMGGLSAAMRRLQITFDDGSKGTYVYKTVLPAGHPRSKDLGGPRESLFYEHLAPTLRSRGVDIPVVLYVHGDMSTGEKTIILEDLSATSVQSGYYFGAGSPHNWNKDLAALMSKDTVPMEVIARETFRKAASIHATYWMDRSLLKHKWLRSQQWLIGEGEDTWQKSQDTASGLWAKTKEKISAGTSAVKWDEHLLQCMDASIAKISWVAYQQEIQSPTYRWTLVHGDFHPANIMWRYAAGEQAGGPVLLDFEVVGLGSGAQDLAQYLISHMSPEDRRIHEEALLRDYHDHLTGATKTGASDTQSYVEPVDYPYVQCRKDFVAGGVGRWVWMLALLSGMCPDVMVQYFHDQVMHFIVDHGVTPETMPMPRV